MGYYNNNFKKLFQFQIIMIANLEKSLKHSLHKIELKVKQYLKKMPTYICIGSVVEILLATVRSIQ